MRRLINSFPNAKLKIKKLKSNFDKKREKFSNTIKEKLNRN